MMLPSRRLSSSSILIGLTAVLAFAVALLIRQAHTDVVALARARHCREVLTGISDLKIAVLSAENSELADLLTRGEYGVARDVARRELRSAYASLSGLLAGDPSGRALPRPAVEGEMQAIDAALTARHLLRSDVDHHPTERILVMLDRMRSEQERLFAEQRARFYRARAALAELSVAAILLAMLCLAAGGVTLRRASARLRQNESLYRLLANNMSDMIVRLDLDLRRTYVSPSAISVCGYEAGELVGTSPLDTSHPDDVPSIERKFRRLADGRTETEVMTFRLRHKHGHFIWVESALGLVRNASGQPEAMIACLRDISGRKIQSDELRTTNLELERLARHLARARDRAEQASSAKTRFLAGMSHELRTPLNGIIGYAHLLRLEGGLTQAQTARVEGMLSAGEHLLGMITHVLDLSEIEADHVDLRTADIDVADTARACLALIEPAANAKGLDLHLVVAARCPPLIQADPARLRQILLNLLGNAVKFTQAGSVELRLSLDPSERDLLIEVADTGPGISAEQSHRLFSEFERLEVDRTDVEGAGLGLAISARLATLMGGRIGYADNRGGGSIFWLKLPIGLVRETSSTPAGEVALLSRRRLRILIVDDVAMNRDIAQAFLRAAGHDAVAVDGGLPALDAVANDRFDAVLMDVRMPGIDGLQAARRIRALPPPAGLVPIVALTAQAFTEQVEECRLAGMNGHLSKPFSPDALLVAIERAVSMDPSSLADASENDAEIAALPLFDPVVLGQTACYLDPGAATPYLETIAARAEALLDRLGGTSSNGMQVASNAHEYAGSAGMFGFSRSCELARRFERAIQTASPDAARLGRQLADAITSTLPAIRSEIERLREAAL